MRKAIILSLLFSVFQCVIAQSATFSITGEGSAFNSKSNSHSHTLYLGAHDNNYYFIQVNSPKSNSAKRSSSTDDDKATLSIIRYGADMSVLATNEIEVSNSINPMGGYVTNNSVMVMMREELNHTIATYRRTYDLSTLQQKGEKELLKSIKVSNNDKHFSSLKESPSGDLLAYVDFIQSANRNVEAQVVLYDTDLEPFWEMDSPIGVYDDMFVSDSGEVILGGYSQAKGSKETHFELIYLDGDKMKSCSFDHELGKVRSMDIVRINNDRIYITGMIQDPTKENIQNTEVSKIFVMVYNLKYQHIENTAFHTISHIEANRMNNLADKFKTRNDIVSYAHFFASTCDDEGATIAYRQSFNYFVNGIPISTKFGGTLVMRIDNKGNIVWTNSLRMSREQSFFFNNQRCGKMVNLGNKVGILVEDNVDNNKRDITQTYKPFVPLKNNPSLVLYLFDRDGNLDRQFYPMPKKSAILGHPHHLHGNDYLIVVTTYGKNSYFATMSIK